MPALGVRPINTLHDNPLGRRDIAPAFQLGPFSGLQIFVMLKEMFDLLGHNRGPRDNERIKRIAVFAQRVRNEAIVRRIAHRRVENTVHEQGARRLIELILHRLPANRHLYDDVDGIGRIVASGDQIYSHGLVVAGDGDQRNRRTSCIPAFPCVQSATLIKIRYLRRARRW